MRRHAEPTDIRIAGRLKGQYEHMSERPETPAMLHRSTARKCIVSFRLSFDDREELKQRAAQEGVTVQTYLERVALGRLDAQDRLPGRAVYTRHPEELPLTG